MLFPAIVHTGLQRILWTDNNRVQILMYHGVNATGDTSYNGRHISVKRFEKHLRYLKKHFEVLSLGEAFNAAGTKKKRKPRVTITFDDGFENNLKYAAPLLKKYDLPATFFISSICVTEETDILWPDVVDLILYNRESVGADGKEFILSKKGFYNSELRKTLQEHIKNQNSEKRDAIIKELAEKYDLNTLKKNSDPEQWKMMTANQVKQLSEFPNVEIGSHCHNHYNLANLSIENAEHELKKSKQLLENCIGKSVTSIAFPDGSYTKKVKQQAYDAGYDKLCAVTFKLPDDMNDPRILRRSAISATTNYYSNVIHFHKHFAKDGN